MSTLRKSSLEKPMRVLLDENLDLRFRHHFPEGVTAETVNFHGWKSLDNGDLLGVAEEDFDALVTLDGSIPHQNNLTTYAIGERVGFISPDKRFRLPKFPKLRKSIVRLHAICVSQNLTDFDLAALVIRTTGDDLDALLELMPALEEALPDAAPGSYREVFPPERS